MKSLGVTRYALTLGGAAALLAACGGSQPPIGAPGGIPQSHTISTNMKRTGSWMLPEAKHASQLLYVSDYGSNQVSVVKLPQGKLIGELDGFDGPFGECTDLAGDVFVADSQAGQIWEYAHGANSPKDILIDTHYYPLGCSVDPVTGNLAVTNEIDTSAGPGNVAIFEKARGKPKYYFDAAITQFGFCTYDDAGNLYAGGSASGAQHLFAELPKHGKRLTALTLNATVSGLSPMRWDGEDLAILDGDPGSLIYRFSITGSTGTEVGILRLQKATEISDFAIQNGTLYAPLLNKNEVGAYAYPDGGKTVKIFFGFGEPAGTAVSILP